MTEWICATCQASFSVSLFYLDHVNTHTGYKPYKCPDCDTLFCQIVDYVEHKSNTCLNANEQLTVKTSHANEVNGSLQQSQGRLSTQGVGPDSKLLKCCLCPQTFPSHDQLKLHRRYHFSKSYLQCKICLLRCSNVKALRHHRRIHVKLKRNVQPVCSNCGQRFYSVRKFEEHVERYPDDHNFTCEFCKKWYPTRKRLDYHECLRLNGTPFRCSCSLEFHTSAEFKRHAGARPFKCCTCDMKFNNLNNLLRHTRTHTKQKPFVCKECGKTFSQSATLKNHQTVHWGNNVMRCKKCLFSCKTSSGLLKHMYKHSQHVPSSTQHYVDARKVSTGVSSCPVCHKEFPFKRNLGMHMKVHSNAWVLCNECGKMFDGKTRFTMHLRVCHGTPSTCKVCGKQFASEVLLASHRRIHTADKQFSCNTCFKMFTVKSYLVQHMKTHDVAKKISCQKCGKMFKVLVSLKYHTKICIGS